MAVTVVVEKSAARVPACRRLQQTYLLRHVRKGAIAVVAEQSVLAVVADEEVVPAIIVVVANTAALAPSAACQAGFEGDVSEGPIAIILEQVRDGFLSLRKTFQ